MIVAPRKIGAPSVLSSREASARALEKGLSLAKGLSLFEEKKNVPFRLFCGGTEYFSNLEIRFLVASPDITEEQVDRCAEMMGSTEQEQTTRTRLPLDLAQMSRPELARAVLVDESSAQPVQDRWCHADGECGVWPGAVRPWVRAYYPVRDRVFQRLLPYADRT